MKFIITNGLSGAKFITNALSRAKFITNEVYLIKVLLPSTADHGKLIAMKRTADQAFGGVDGWGGRRNWEPQLAKQPTSHGE